jgi:hypothetical protein
MEIVESADSSPKQHIWLKWTGLQKPPVEADSWVPVVRGLTDLEVDPANPGTSTVGARLVKLLSDAGIDASQRSYQFDESYVTNIYSGAKGEMETRVAVLVHDRDHARAVAIAVELNKTLEREDTKLITDEELGERQ